MHRNVASYAVVKTILVFLVFLTIGLVLPNAVWAHGGGGDGSGSGGGGSSSSAGGGGVIVAMGAAAAAVLGVAAMVAAAAALEAAAAQATAAVLTPARTAREDKWDTAPREGQQESAAARV
jgi:hypothetical protein